MPRRTLHYAPRELRLARLYGGVSRTLVWVNLVSLLLGAGMLLWMGSLDTIWRALLFPLAVILGTAQVLTSVLPTAGHAMTRDIAIRWWEWLILLLPMVGGLGCTVAALAL